MKKNGITLAAAATALLVFAGCHSHDALPRCGFPGCKEPGCQTPVTQLTGNWVLKSLANPAAAKLSKPQQPVTMDFQGSRVAGCAGVNRYFGSFKLTSGSIKFGPLGSTMMAGPDLAYEQFVLEMLNTADRVEVLHGELQLFKGEMLLGTFVPAPQK